MVMITLYVRQQKRHRCIEQILDPVGEGEGGMIWENCIETCIMSYMKWKKNESNLPAFKDSEVIINPFLGKKNELTAKRIGAKYL